MSDALDPAAAGRPPNGPPVEEGWNLIHRPADNAIACIFRRGGSWDLAGRISTALPPGWVLGPRVDQIEARLAFLERRESELLAANTAGDERRRAAEHQAECWRLAAQLVAEAYWLVDARAKAIAAALQRLRDGDPDGHIPIRGPHPPAEPGPATEPSG